MDTNSVIRSLRYFLRAVKVFLSFIGHSGSNHSAFYVYRATNAVLSSIPHYVHA